MDLLGGVDSRKRVEDEPALDDDAASCGGVHWRRRNSPSLSSMAPCLAILLIVLVLSFLFLAPRLVLGRREGGESSSVAPSSPNDDSSP